MWYFFFGESVGSQTYILTIISCVMIVVGLFLYTLWRTRK